MFKKFFMKDEEEEEVYETVDPVLEQGVKRNLAPLSFIMRKKRKRSKKKRKRLKKLNLRNSYLL